MRKNTITGFTLIEMVVVVTIVITLSLTTYIPYLYQGNKVKLNHSVKDIGKTIHEARNMAINGVSKSDENVSVALYLDASDTMKHKIQLLTYPHSFSGTDIKKSGENINILKEYTLQPGVEVETIQEQTNMLIFFHAISGIPEQYYWDSNEDRVQFDEKSIDIKVSYKGATTDTLQKQIQYFPETNVINY